MGVIASFTEIEIIIITYSTIGNSFQAPAKQIPRTLENTREVDETTLQPDDEEVELDDLTDEFASYFAKEYVPKILITTVDKPRTSTIKFCRELELVLPNAEFRYRNYAHIKKTLPQAIEKGFTDFLGRDMVFSLCTVEVFFLAELA